MKIIFLGAPGAGKGTQADRVSNILGIPTISTGVIIREAIKNGTELGEKAKKFIDAGELCPDDVVIGIIKARLQKSDCGKGFILDGFPRTVRQAEELREMGVDLDVAVSIEVPDEVIVERMSGRRVCASCGLSYHTNDNPSKDGKTCDRCHTELTQRADDAAEVVLNRLETYHEKTEPLKEYYAQSGKLKIVEGQEEVKDTSALTLAALED
jgi:adenylate kinase